MIINNYCNQLIIYSNWIPEEFLIIFSTNIDFLNFSSFLGVWLYSRLFTEMSGLINPFSPEGRRPEDGTGSARG